MTLETTKNHINYLLRAYCAILNTNISANFATNCNQEMKNFPLKSRVALILGHPLNPNAECNHQLVSCLEIPFLDFNSYLQISSDKLRMHGDSWKQHAVVQNKPITIQGILMSSVTEAGQFKTQVGSKIQLISLFLLTPQLGRLFFTNCLRLSFRCSLSVLELVIFSANLLCSHTSSQHY